MLEIKMFLAVENGDHICSPQRKLWVRANILSR